MSDSSQASGLLHDLINESARQQDIVFPVVNDANELINVGIVLQLNGPTDVPELQAHGLTRAAVYVDLATEQVTGITPWPGPVPRPSTNH